MHMILLALAALSGAADPEPKAFPPVAISAAPMCQNVTPHLARLDQRPAMPRTLRNEPLADGYLAVLRLEGGCDKPIKVRERVGGR